CARWNSNYDAMDYW
nr:immunoglobulin heavy chain junction region [Mus musculus]MBK4184089.1 immunoglobulin heavy chain junction region [Mus musculus]